ncbi:hypothetical protein PV04_09485 [Phialophora macrospora]|uniref:Uncharacterized protein n=1 Tax=Phialophora macrospora TaxID=1851006 RepID=A0A0D2FCL1_9EURO|nr:hypothetical protein PV04_09485 [Phialophora macrospora]
MSSSASLSSTSTWPSIVNELDWPASGVRFHYEDRYLSPDKLSLWLRTVFGPGVGKYVIYNSHYYVAAPRKPTKKELQWLMDPDRRGGVDVPGVGYLSLV